MTHSEYHRLPAHQLGWPDAEVVVHGHYGRPVLWFPSEGGSPHDFAGNGILESVRGAVDDGRIKIYCAPSYDATSWSANDKPLGDRAKAHLAYDDWVVWTLAPAIREHSGGRGDIATAGTSMGAFHAALFALRHPHVFNHAVAMSGNYDPRGWHAWGEVTDEVYACNPMQFVPGWYGDHLDWVRRTARLTLVVGSGQWEDTTGANASTHALADQLRDKGIPHDLFVWGHEWPHDWPSWRAQSAMYLPALG